MVVFAPPKYVEVVHPAPPPVRFGLNSVATVINDDELASKGVSFDDADCAELDISIPDCPPDDPPEPQRGAGGREATPFYLHSSYQCSPVGHDIASHVDRLNVRLDRGRLRTIERAIGVDTTEHSQTLPTGADDLGGSFSLAHAIGLLEDAIDSGGMGGVIHVPRSLSGLLAAQHLVSVEGDQLVTLLGTPVALISSPDGVDGAPTSVGTAWIYTTSPVTVYLGDVFVAPDDPAALDFMTNDVNLVATQPVTVTWSSCVHAGVLVEVE